MGNFLSKEQSCILQKHVDGFDPSSLATVIWDTIREIGQNDKHDNFGIDFSKFDDDNNQSIVTFWDGDYKNQLPRQDFLRVLEYIAESTLTSYAELYDLKRSPEIAAKTARLERALYALRQELPLDDAHNDPTSDQLLVSGEADSPALPPVLVTLPVPGLPGQSITDTRTHRSSCAWMPPGRRTMEDTDDDKNSIFTIPEENEDVKVSSMSSLSSQYLGSRLSERRHSIGSGRRLSDSDESVRRLSDELGQCLSDGRLTPDSAGRQPSWQYSSDEIGQCYGDVPQCEGKKSNRSDHKFSDDYGQKNSYRRERRFSEGGFHHPHSVRRLSYSEKVAHHSFDEVSHSKPTLQRSKKIDEDDNTRQCSGMPQLYPGRRALNRNDTSYSCSSDNSSIDDEDVFRPSSPRRLYSTAGRGMEAVIERLPELRERYERTLNEQNSSQKVRKLKYKLQSLASFKSLSESGTEV